MLVRVNKLILSLFTIAILLAVSCDSSRIYEENIVLENKFWEADSIKKFEFVIPDKTSEYSLFLNVRNANNYAYNNIYVRYTLLDTLDNILTSELVSNNLFEPKTGDPMGESSIGNVFDHQFKLIEGQRFERSGKYVMKLQQYMRTDTLNGILMIGVRVEKNQEKQ